MIPKHLTTPKTSTRKTDRLNNNSFSSAFQTKSRTALTTAVTPNRPRGRFSINEKNETVFQNVNFSPSSFIDHSQYIHNNYSSDDKTTLSFALLKTMNPKNTIHYLNQSPLFLKTMVSEGFIDPEIVSSVSLSLTQNELQAFIQNMTNELNVFSSIHNCDSLQKVESQILEIIPLTRATIWTKCDFSDFLYSSSMKTVLPINKSIVGHPFFDKQDLVTGDPSHHSAFNIDYDMPFLRSIQSMILLPIFWPDGEIASIFQCVGLKDQATDAQIEFTDYLIETIKIIRDILQKKFFSQIQTKVVPSDVATIFAELDKCSLSTSVIQITKYLQNCIPCENVDIFEFDDKSKILTKLIDNTTYTEETGGISIQAAMTNSPINLSHNQVLKELKCEIDTKLTNRSIFALSLYYQRQHFVLTVRGKPNSPAFNSFDSQLIVSLMPLICDSLKLSKWLQKESLRVHQIEDDMKLMTVINNTLTDVSVKGVDKWTAIKNASKLFFDDVDLYIALFDGRYMQYYSTDVKCKFEDCTAGVAYNFREALIGNLDDEKSKFNCEVYKSLNVECTSTFAFPYRVGGKVVGAIELINPPQMDISVEKQKLFSNLCACLLGNPIGSILT